MAADDPVPECPSAGRPPLGGLVDAGERTRELRSGFLMHFRGQDQFVELPSIPVTSRVDPSVFFIGSIMNVVKTQVLERRMPRAGVYMSQTCLRTQPLKSIRAGKLPQYGSVFETLGAVVTATETESLARTFDSWLRSLSYSLPDRLVLLMSKDDHELRALAARYFPLFEIQFNTQASRFYRHTYGFKGLRGKNLNFGVRRPSGLVQGIGNFVMMELNDREIASEVGISVPLFLAVHQDLEHPVLATPAAESLTFRSSADVMLADCLNIAQLLLSEGMKPRADGRQKYLKFALREAALLLVVSSNDLEDVRRTVHQVFAFQEQECEGLCERVIRYIAQIQTDEMTGRPRREQRDVLTDIL